MSDDTEKVVVGNGPGVAAGAYRVKSDGSVTDPDPSDASDAVHDPAYADAEADAEHADETFSPAEQKRIIRHIDRRLVVTLGLMYCVSLIDRTNLGSAQIAGMARDLVLYKGERYSIITLIFFVPYIILQPPSTVLVRAIGPRIHLAAITLFWGATMIGMGFVHSWNAMAGLRALLGILEAGFFPSCVYLLSTWYTRYEVGKRNGLFYLLGCVASAFAGLLAAGIMQMDGLQGLAGWRWIFIIEGLLTCLLGIAGYWLLVDFPDAARRTWGFLGPRERAWVIARVNADRGDAALPPFQLRRFLHAAADWRVWAYGLLFFAATTITYALAYFLPTILVGSMHFSIIKAQCLAAPPFIFAGLLLFVTGALGDRYRLRGPIVVFNALLCLIGLPILGYHHRPAVRYFAVFLVTAGANGNIPAVMSFQANNVRGQWKRAASSALFVALGGIGGIAGSLVFRSQDAPNYRPGIWACIAVSLLSLLLVAALDISFYLANKKADRLGISLEDSEGEYPPGFRYTY